MAAGPAWSSGQPQQPAEIPVRIERPGIRRDVRRQRDLDGVRTEQHHLPVKLHCGYYVGSGRRPLVRVRPNAADLCPLLADFPNVRFVLMHIGYPYQDEYIALAKHYPNAHIDLCWAWAVDPYSTMDFVRRVVHAVPASKLFAFGGDTFWPSAAAAYATQARHWLTRALHAEVEAGRAPFSKAAAPAIIGDEKLVPLSITNPDPLIAV